MDNFQELFKTTRNNSAQISLDEKFLNFVNRKKFSKSSVTHVNNFPFRWIFHPEHLPTK